MSTKLMIATPILGAPETEFSTSLLAATISLPRMGIGVAVKQLAGESLVTRARNSLVHDFLKSDCTHLMFIDSDIVFAPESIAKLVAHDRDVVCGAYPKKKIDWDAVRDAALSGTPAHQLAEAAGVMVLTLKPEDAASGGVTTDGDLLEVMDVATGFMLVKRTVFETMATQMPELMIISDAESTRGEPMFGFFLEEVEPGTHRHLSEDYAFSRRCQRLGIKCWVDCTVRLGHVGRYVYRGSVENLFEPDRTSSVTNELPASDADSENLDVDANPTGRIERLHIERYEWAANHLAGYDVPEIANAACGYGYGNRILHDRLTSTIVGYDASQAAIDVARSRNPDDQFYQADISDMSFSMFDALVCIETLEHLADPWKFLRNLGTSYLVLTTPIIPTKHRNPFHLHDFTKPQIDTALLTAGFQILDYAQQCDDVGMWFCKRVHP